MPRLVTPVILVLISIQVFYLGVAQGLCKPEGFLEVLEEGQCPQKYRYRRCDTDAWTNAMCVGRRINGTSRSCQLSPGVCQQNDVTTTLLTRRKRQANRVQDCTRTYACPTLKELFIYPDWSNTDCDTYVMCLYGATSVGSCKDFGYMYYNPRRNSCEDTPVMTNTCFHRMSTDLTTILK